MKILWILWLCCGSPLALGRNLYLNGYDISSATEQTLNQVDIHIDGQGSIFITAPQYQIFQEDAYLPLRPHPQQPHPKTHQKKPGAAQHPSELPIHTMAEYPQAPLAMLPDLPVGTITRAHTGTEGGFAASLNPNGPDGKSETADSNKADSNEEPSSPPLSALLQENSPRGTMPGAEAFPPLTSPLASPDPPADDTPPPSASAPFEASAAPPLSPAQNTSEQPPPSVAPEIQPPPPANALPSKAEETAL